MGVAGEIVHEKIVPLTLVQYHTRPAYMVFIFLKNKRPLFKSDDGNRATATGATELAS